MKVAISPWKLGMVRLEHIPEEDGADWPLQANTHLSWTIFGRLQKLPALIKISGRSSGIRDPVIRSIEEGLKIKNGQSSPRCKALS